MTKIFKVVLTLILLCMPVLVIFSFMNKSFDLGGIIYSVENIPIIEDFNELSSLLKDLPEINDFSDFAEYTANLLKIGAQILFVDPVTTIIYVFKVIFG